MPAPKEEDIKVRVTIGMREAMQALADKNDSTLSQIGRDALTEFLKGLGYTDKQLRSSERTNSTSAPVRLKIPKKQNHHDL